EHASYVFERHAAGDRVDGTGVAQHVRVGLAHCSDLGFDFCNSSLNAQRTKTIAPAKAAAAFVAIGKTEGLLCRTARLGRDRAQSTSYLRSKQDGCNFPVFRTAISQNVVCPKVDAWRESHDIDDGKPAPAA